MRILLDTNIFIPLEDSSIDIGEKLADLNRLASGKHELLLHPATIDDINRDKDEVRRKSSLSRIKKYNLLEAPPAFAVGEEESLIGAPRKDNDRVDNLILLSLYRDCVNWLVTQDDGIHKKAKVLGQEERVLTVEQAITALSQQESRELKLYPTIDDMPCHALDLKDPFFDTLRKSYDGFDDWFTQKCARGGRRVWRAGNDSETHAICIYKDEQDPIVNTDKQGLPGKVLKLCTFKVVKRGYKIGELLLKQAFNYSADNNMDYLYVTVESGRHKLLEELFLDFGFYLYGTDTKGRDLVFVKHFPRNFPIDSLPPLEYAIKYFPLSKITNNKVYIVPIQPQYHETLFAELKDQGDLFEESQSSAGNAIKQAYLCKSNIKAIKPGDILFFYRTIDEKAITTYGIVDQFHMESDPEKIFQWVSKRTVYSYDEIEEMAGKIVKVILFRLIGHLENHINFKRLKELRVVTGPIQSITNISNEKAKKLLNEAELNDCILSD